MNRLPRTVMDRIAMTAAALHVALCAGAVAAGPAHAAVGATTSVQDPGVALPRGGPLPPMPPPPPEPPRAPAAPAPPPPQPQPRPSLANLAVAALPGMLGLAGLSGFGGYVGYRQAKAGFALRAAGTARFLP